jgi:inner membrane transporter RhtA
MEPETPGLARPAATPTARVPPQAFFLVSALFHYLGPSFAVLLFARLAPLGVAWLRIATAAAVYGAWCRPWRAWGAMPRDERRLVFALGVVLALMNCCFYLAIARLQLGTVGAIEFLGPIGLAAAGSRTARNLAALGFAAAGAFVLTDVRVDGDLLAYGFAFANCGLFALYIVLGHRVASGAGSLDRLSAAMLVATAAVTPVGLVGAAPAFTDPLLLGAGFGVGVTSSVIPYLCDQLAMARLPRASFALMLALLPATASLVGLVVLRQAPSPADVVGIGLVVVGVALHRQAG